MATKGPADHSAAWVEFWARNRGSGGDGGGCLPARWAGIESVQKVAWAEFAKDLPRKTRVLDLATGDGRVMRWLLQARRDLKPLGCDLADPLPDPPEGTKIRAGVAMEELPFGDQQFAASVSQFGFEYGDSAAAARELARVTRSGGLVALRTHRKDGPILEHNLNRRAAIDWVLHDQGLIEKAKGSLAMRNLGGGPVPPLIAQAPEQGAAKFGAQSAAWEIAEAIRRTLLMGARDDPRRVAATLDEIARQAANEIGRIASLEAACGTAASDAFEPALADAGLESVSTVPLSEADTQRAFADMRIYRKL